MVFHKGQYGDILRTSYFNFLRMPVEDVRKTSVLGVSWSYIEDHMWTSMVLYVTPRNVPYRCPEEESLRSDYSLLLIEPCFSFTYWNIIVILKYYTVTKRSYHLNCWKSHKYLFIPIFVNYFFLFFNFIYFIINFIIFKYFWKNSYNWVIYCSSFFKTFTGSTWFFSWTLIAFICFSETFLS